MTTVTTITCPECGYTIFSRARHDMRGCKCGKVFIDGGFDYVKISFNPEIEPPKPQKKEVPQTPLQLYDDWNKRTDQYGLIPPIFKKEK